MKRKEVCSLGGQATAKIFRDKALKRYYDNPNICKFCNEIIKVDSKRVAEVRKKKFCDRSCAAKYNNSLRPKKEKSIKTKKTYSGPKWIWLLNKTKKEIFDKHKNWQSARTSIRRHAIWVYNKYNPEKKCKNCGYSKHIEVCHIKAVSEFSNNTLIDDINSRDNLIGLCPNCHWEFDNNMLKI